MTVQHEGAREYLTRLIGVDMSDLTAEQAEKAIDHYYPGGWPEFAKGWGEGAVPIETYAPDLKRVVKAEPTRFQMIQSVQKMTGQAIRVGLLDEILEIKIRPEVITVGIKIFKVVEQASRWKVTNQGLRQLTWKKVNDFWVRQHDTEVWIPEGIYETREIHNFGTIQTDAVWNDKRDQFHLCYRPGTARSPMQGPHARIEEHGFQYYDRYEKHYYGDED